MRTDSSTLSPPLKSGASRMLPGTRRSYTPRASFPTQTTRLSLMRYPKLHSTSTSPRSPQLQHQHCACVHHAVIGTLQRHSNLISLVLYDNCFITFAAPDSANDGANKHICVPAAHVLCIPASGPPQENDASIPQFPPEGRLNPGFRLA